MNLIPHYWEKYNRSLAAYGPDDPVTREHWGEYVLVHKAEHTALHKPPVASDRVEVPVWEYLHNESTRLAGVKQDVINQRIGIDHAFEIMFDSYTELLLILSQQQKARDENG